MRLWIVPPGTICYPFSTASSSTLCCAAPCTPATCAPQANLQLVVNIAKEYTEQLGSDKIIAMLESYNSYPGLYLYLGSRIAFT